MTEFFRPWKLATLAIGIALLLLGDWYYENAPDWDVGVSIIMGLLTYLTAPWAVRVVWERRWNKLWLAIIAWLVTVDISYYVYHHLMGNEMLRWENFLTSTCLYFLCGFIWLHNGSLKETLDRPAVSPESVPSTKETTPC